MALTQGTKGAVTLLAALDHDDDDEVFYHLLMGLSLPAYTGTQSEPYRAVMHALREVELLGLTIQHVRKRLASRLARFMRTAPAEGAFAFGGARLLFNMYQLAGELACPQELEDALEQEVRREEARRTVTTDGVERGGDRSHAGGPARRFLFHACIENQRDGRFAWLWQAVMEDVSEAKGGIRWYWGVHWGEAFQGICLAPNRRNAERIARPSFAGFVRALPFLLESIDQEFKAGKERDPARLLRVWLERFCRAWMLPMDSLLPFVMLSDSVPQRLGLGYPQCDRLDLHDQLIQSMRDGIRGADFDHQVFQSVDTDHDFVYRVAYNQPLHDPTAPVQVVYYWALREYLGMPDGGSTRIARLRLKSIVNASGLDLMVEQDTAQAVIALAPEAFDLAA